jgi:hypothetical protein
VTISAVNRRCRRMALACFGFVLLNRPGFAGGRFV